MSANRKSKSEKEREKMVQDRLQILLTRMLQDEDNKYCVDCDSKGYFFILYRYCFAEDPISDIGALISTLLIILH